MQRPDALRAAELEIRPDDHVALADGRALALSVRELGLLVALAEAEGRVLSREQLYGRVWGGRLRSDDRSVDVYVHKLRSKLTAALPAWRFIHTHFGFGYRFGAEPFTSVSQHGHDAVTGSQAGA